MAARTDHARFVFDGPVDGGRHDPTAFQVVIPASDRVPGDRLVTVDRHSVVVEFRPGLVALAEGVGVSQGAVRSPGGYPSSAGTIDLTAAGDE